MKTSLKKELAQMSVENLQTRVVEIKKELFDLRMKKISNPEKNTALERNLRKSLACTLTFLGQKD